MGDEHITAGGFDDRGGGYGGHVFLELLQDGVTVGRLLRVVLLVGCNRASKHLAHHVLPELALGATGQYVHGAGEGGVLGLFVVGEGVHHVTLHLGEQAALHGLHRRVLQRLQRVEFLHDGIAIHMRLSVVQQVRLGHGQLVGQRRVLLEVLLQGEGHFVGSHGGIDLLEHRVVHVLQIVVDLLTIVIQTLCHHTTHLRVHRRAK
mmetsp:Transcript_18183/g.30507  ORF Transcript_18183/g.30507 Transcript_18183/m.30507 type:complete len:205 (+) Transcript_18183:256-870(+)